MVTSVTLTYPVLTVAVTTTHPGTLLTHVQVVQAPGIGQRPLTLQPPETSCSRPEILMITGYERMLPNIVIRVGKNNSSDFPQHWSRRKEKEKPVVYFCMSN